MRLLWADYIENKPEWSEPLTQQPEWSLLTHLAEPLRDSRTGPLCLACRAPGAASTENQELPEPLSLGQGRFSAYLEVSAREGLFWDVPFSLPWAKCSNPQVRPDSPFLLSPRRKGGPFPLPVATCFKEAPRAPGKCDLPVPSPLNWPPERGCKAQAQNILLASSQQPGKDLPAQFGPFDFLFFRI